MAFSREHIRESTERADDEHWEPPRPPPHRRFVYLEGNPGSGDVCRAEAKRLNDLGFDDNPNLELVQSRVDRVPPRDLYKTGASGSATGAGDQCPLARDWQRGSLGALLLDPRRCRRVRLDLRVFEDTWTLPGVSRRKSRASTRAPGLARSAKRWHVGSTRVFDAIMGYVMSSA